MLIYDPVANFLSEVAARRQLYRCVVDGRDELMGEKLPVGTKENIVAWIKSRYKVLGEIFVVNSEGVAWNGFIFCSGSPLFTSEVFMPRQQMSRYLVEVDEGAEKVFVLLPVPMGLLEWHPGRALTDARTGVCEYGPRLPSQFGDFQFE